MKKREFPRLEIKLDGQVFRTTFATLDDVLKDEVWRVGTMALHEVIKGHFRK